MRFTTSGARKARKRLLVLWPYLVPRVQTHILSALLADQRPSQIQNLAHVANKSISVYNTTIPDYLIVQIAHERGQ